MQHHWETYVLVLDVSYELRADLATGDEGGLLLPEVELEQSCHSVGVKDLC